MGGRGPYASMTPKAWCRARTRRSSWPTGTWWSTTSDRPTARTSLPARRRRLDPRPAECPDHHHPRHSGRPRPPRVPLRVAHQVSSLRGIDRTSLTCFPVVARGAHRVHHTYAMRHRGQRRVPQSAAPEPILLAAADKTVDHGLGRAGRAPGGAVQEMVVEPLLGIQDFLRIGLAVGHSVQQSEVVESFQSWSENNQHVCR